MKRLAALAMTCVLAAACGSDPGAQPSPEEAERDFDSIGIPVTIDGIPMRVDTTGGWVFHIAPSGTTTFNGEGVEVVERVLRIGGRSYGAVDADDQVLLSSRGVEVNGELRAAR